MASDERFSFRGADQSRAGSAAIASQVSMEWNPASDGVEGAADRGLGKVPLFPMIKVVIILKIAGRRVANKSYLPADRISYQSIGGRRSRHNRGTDDLCMFVFAMR